MQNEKPATLLTEGSIWKKMIAFAVPIFFGNLFQQLYNTADSLIVGNFVGSDALAAVSSSGNLIFLMVGFFSGISMGAGVVIARYYGARSGKEVSLAVHTLTAFGLAAGVALTIAGVLVTPQILRWMGTPESVFPNSVLYFRIYFAGSLGFVMYNIFVGILQSIGDSRRPLMYLIISSVTNVALDLLFIAVMGMGVGAAAFATVLSQFASAALCLSRLMRAKEEYRIVLKEIRFDRNMMRQIISNGFAELDYCTGKCGCTVQYQCVWHDGSGWVRRLFQNRRVWVFAHHLFCPFPDYLYQPESRGKRIWQG